MVVGFFLEEFIKKDRGFVLGFAPYFHLINIIYYYFRYFFNTTPTTIENRENRAK